VKRRKAGMLLGFIIATLFLIIGYAAVTDINLTINGTASAGSSNDNFNVQMVAGSLTTDGTSQNITVTDTTVTSETQLNVSFAASGFSAKGDTAVITYTLENKSNDLQAILSSTGVNVSVPQNTDNLTYYADSKDLFDVNYYFNDTEDTKNITIDSTSGFNTTTVTVTITLNKTIVNEENVVINVNLPINAKAN
jgi:hypothetical protein